MLLAGIGLLLPVPPASVAVPAAGAEPMIVKIGMGSVDLSYLDLAGATFSIAKWQWFAHSSADYKPYATTEIVNAAAFATEAGFEEVRGDTVWSPAKYRAGLHAAGAAPTMHIAAQARLRATAPAQRCALV